MKKLILTVAALLVASTTLASSGGSLWNWYVIPAAAHLQGKLGTFWQTDVSIVNPYSWRSITVTVFYLREEQDNSSATGRDFDLAPSTNLVLPDIVYTTFGAQSKGALLIYTADGAYFSVTARTYTGTTATYGQTENGQANVSIGGSTAYITGVADNSSFRTNVGAVNASSRVINLQITAYDRYGVQHGSHLLTLMPWGMSQIAVSSFSSSFTNGYLKIHCVDTNSDIQWVAYATPVDNSSGDSVFLEERVDLQGTWAHPLYDLTGWWEGTISTAQGSGSAYLLIAETGSKVSGLVYTLDGYLDSVLTGFENQGALSISSWTAMSAPCLASQLVSGQITTDGSSIYGNITVTAQDYRCINGPETFFFTSMSYSPFGAAMGDAAAAATRTTSHRRLGIGSPQARDAR